MKKLVYERDNKFPLNLYCSLMMVSFIPFIYTLVRTNLIAHIPLTDGLGIAGHIEWFDLLNETIQAFLIVPLFALLIMWGLLLIPITALAEIIKKDCKDTLTSAKMKYYNIIIIATFLMWLCFIPLLSPFLRNVMGIENPGAIEHILVILIPFYLAYNYTVLLDNILIGNGKTQYCFAISVIVNLIYYPIMYGLVLKGVFTPSITFICMMFGFGMVTHLGCSIICFIIYKRYSWKNR